MLSYSLPLRRMNFRLSLKYPSLVSYNKLPWEIVNHGSNKLHQHVAPYYKQILSVASISSIPNLIVAKHPSVVEAQRLRVLPGRVYLMKGGKIEPEGFSSHQILDHTSLQYYGCVDAVAKVKQVEVLISEDLRLLCLAVSFTGVKEKLSDGSLKELGADAQENGEFTLYHYFRPNRPANELTRPLDRFYIHRPQTGLFEEFEKAQWEPKLKIPSRDKNEKVTPLPSYRPPESYLMGLAERMAVIPGNSFGRRSLMWGHWF